MKTDIKTGWHSFWTLFEKPPGYVVGFLAAMMVLDLIGDLMFFFGEVILRVVGLI